MKNILKIYKRDLKTICTNWAAGLMVIVLILIPSLYSLINIKASWDPYSNTNGIKIAIINNDKGTVFKDEDINLGDELVDKLKDNDKMGWEFVSKDEGTNGLILEKYYATIELPEDFSEDLTTIVEKEVVKPKIIYTVNEKKNSIAPKLTDAGVKSVKSELDNNIIKTISGVLFRICDETGVEVDSKRPDLRKIINDIYDLDEKMPEIEQLLSDAIDGTGEINDLLIKTNDVIPSVSETLDLTDDFINNSNEYLNKAQSDLADISPMIKNELVLSESMLDSASVDLRNLDENVLPETAKSALQTTLDTAKATRKTSKDLKEKLKSINEFLEKLLDYNVPSFDKNIEDEKIKKAQDELKKQAKALENMKDSLEKVSSSIEDIIDKLDIINDKLDILIPRIEDKIEDLDNGKGLDIQTLTDIRKEISNLDTFISNVISVYDNDIVSFVETGFDGIGDISDNGLIIVGEVRDALVPIEELISSSLDATNLTKDELVNLQNKFPDGKDKIHELADKLREMDEEDRFNEIIDMVTNDYDKQSEFLSSPVEIENNRLFPMPNYGSASAPFYTVLCLWVGALIGSALLCLEAVEDEENKYKSFEVYFGKLLTFISIGIFQSLVASLGFLYGLKGYVLHPVMFIFYCIFVSIVFMVVVYTAASLLDDVGKAMIVVILVFQLAGTSGTFPIEVVPDMFKKIYLYFPFTYATNGMRQISAGIVYPILIKDMTYLSIYMVISLMCGIFLKGSVNKVTEKIVKKLYKSGILRH